jgi:hypothetical protein
MDYRIARHEIIGRTLEKLVPSERIVSNLDKEMFPVREQLISRSNFIICNILHGSQHGSLIQDRFCNKNHKY